MLFTAAPQSAYRAEDGHLLRWRGYDDPRHLFACRCEDYLWVRKCGHSAALSQLYEFAAKYWPDAASTFWGSLGYYQTERAKVLAKEEAAVDVGDPAV